MLHPISSTVVSFVKERNSSNVFAKSFTSVELKLTFVLALYLKITGPILSLNSKSPAMKEGGKLPFFWLLQKKKN